MNDHKKDIEVFQDGSIENSPHMVGSTGLANPNYKLQYDDLDRKFEKMRKAFIEMHQRMTAVEQWIGDGRYLIDKVRQLDRLERKIEDLEAILKDRDTKSVFSKVYECIKMKIERLMKF